MFIVERPEMDRSRWVGFGAMEPCSDDLLKPKTVEEGVFIVVNGGNGLVEVWTSPCFRLGLKHPHNPQI